MTHDAAIDALREQIVTLTGIPDGRVVHGPIDAPRRELPWVTLIVLSDTPIGLPHRVGDTVHHAREVAVLVTAYGQAAVDGMRAAVSLIWSDTPAGMAALAEGVTLRRVAPLTDAPTVVRTAHEPRASTTIRIGYVAAISSTAPASADSVVVDLTADDAEHPAAITIDTGA